MVDPVSDQDSPGLPQTEDASREGKTPQPRLPEHISRYHVKRIIDSGGMGTVFEATQENPRRVVAVKVMKQGIASKSALRRFEYEGQILGRLRHPGIAQIFEAGMHTDREGILGPAGSSVPFFAMEYIPNAKPITRFADEKTLSTRNRMALFAKVCDAIHHGHQKGIIHRDLKPGNILVDSGGQVKIIDFGVARSTDSDLAITTLQTDVGQLIGTLQYMSPEQCEADPHDIDIRSDVYSLGVVFYELLCGKTPYDVRGMPIYQATWAIRDQSPTKLSTLDKTLRGDVETIALKALEKERERRYQSTADFAHDIQRYLDGEPILAHRASIVYQLRLLARRHKNVFASLAVVFVVLLTGVIVSSSLYLRAERARAETKLQWERAEQEAQTAQQVTDFLVDLFQVSDPGEARGRAITAREILDRGAEKIGKELSNQPELQARLMNTMGNVYLGLGLYDSAAPLLRAALENRRRALGGEHADIAASLNNLANLLWEKGAYAAAEPLYRDALAMQRKLLGDEHPTFANSLNNLAALLNHKGDYAASELLYREALAIQRKRLGNDHPRVAATLNNLASLLREKGDYAAAEQMFLEALATRRKLLGDEHPRVADSLNNLAAVINDKHDYAAAEPLFRQALAMYRKLLGEEHPRVANSLKNIAGLLKDKGDFVGAEPLCRQALAMNRKLLGDGHPDVAESLVRLSDLLITVGSAKDAESLLGEALQILQEALPENHVRIAEAKGILGMCLARQGRFEPAEPLVLESFTRITAALGRHSRASFDGLERPIHLYDAWDAAEPGKGNAEKAAEWRAKLEEEGTKPRSHGGTERNGEPP